MQDFGDTERKSVQSVQSVTHEGKATTGVGVVAFDTVFAAPATCSEHTSVSFNDGEVISEYQPSARRRLELSSGILPSASSSSSSSSSSSQPFWFSNVDKGNSKRPLLFNSSLTLIRRRIIGRSSLLIRKIMTKMRQLASDQTYRAAFSRVTGTLLISSSSGSYTDNLLALLYTLAWMCVSSGLIMLNKYILSSLKFEYPLTLCSLGMLFSGIVSAVLFKFFKVGYNGDDNQFKSFQEYCKIILPIGLASSLPLYWGNYAYLFISVSFIQMLKAFTPVITMIVLFIFGMERVRSSLMMAVLMMTLGTALASYGETDFNIIGFISMAISETMEALKLVAMQFLLAGPGGSQTSKRKFGLFEGLYYFAPATFFWLLLGIVFTEGSRFLQMGGHIIMKENALIFLLASSMGFGVNILTLGVVKYTSSLTYKIVAQVKNALTVYASVLIFHNAVTSMQITGYGASIVGFLW